MTTPARRVALLLPGGYLDSTPCLMSTVTLLARHGYAVDVFVTHDPTYVPPTFEEKAEVTVHTLSGAPVQGSIHRIVSLIRWTVQVYRACRDQRYVCFVGIDPWGLLLATMAGRLLSIARAYFSLEIWVSAEIRQRHWLWVKWLERVCNRSCRFTIVQDEDRARLLMAENHIPQSQVVLVPNSFLGPPTKRKTVYLYQKLGIPADKKIILHAGSLQHWTMALELVEAAHDWPDEWALVLQSRQHLGTGEYDICLRSKIDSQHVFLCGDPVPSREMSDLVASGDIGVALYRTGPSHVLGANQLWAGLGSGKIASYLHHGLPVVTVNFPSLTQLVEGCACGKVVPDAGAVGRAIAEILADYPTYSANALCCYQERFDFEQAFEQVLQRLGEIS